MNSSVQKLPIALNVEQDEDLGRTLDFETVYQTWFHEVCRWTRALGGLDGDLDDLAQEVFLVVRRKLPSFDGRNIKGWLYRIAQRTVSNYRRTAWYRSVFTRKSSVESEQQLLRAVDPGRDPVEQLERREAERWLALIFSQMKASHRVAFILFTIEGYSGEEIAELEGVPVNTVWTRLHNARKEFHDVTERLRRKGNLG
jgi:RNA polymerase sigma-70 factor, ECF subfamily